jgi:curli biogenesis system outer membrane secretion channel CsgG
MISKRRLSSFAILLALACGLVLAPARAQAPRKLRVAVLDLDYAAVQSETSALFGSSIDVGRGIADLLTTDLVNDGTFSIIGREALERSMDEGDFSDSDRSDPASAIRLGKLLRADAIIIGSVTQFDTGSRNNDSGAGGADSKSHVHILASIIDVESGQIQGVAEGAGESSGSFTTWGGWNGWSRGNVNLASRDFQQTVIGKAVKAAVDQLSGNLILNASKAPLLNASKPIQPTAKPEGLVAAVDGGRVILNIGTGVGVMPGDLLEAFRVTKEVKDPTTGEVIRHLTTTVGVIKVTDVDARSSICTIVSGSGFKEGDHVRAAQ